MESMLKSNSNAIRAGMGKVFSSFMIFGIVDVDEPVIIKLLARINIANPVTNVSLRMLSA